MMSQPSSDYTTIQDGLWNSVSTWEDGNIPPCSIQGGDIVHIYHEVVSSCSPMNIRGAGKNGEVIVYDGGSLEITDGNLTGNGVLTIQEGAEIVVDGNVDVNGKSNLKVDGVLTFHGDVNAGIGNILFHGEGTAYVSGIGCEYWECYKDYSSACNGVCVQDALPLSLIEYKVSINQYSGLVKIRWVTLNEKDVDHYFVTRNGENIGQVSSLNGIQNTYEITDFNGFGGYRLYEVAINNDTVFIAMQKLEGTDTSAVIGSISGGIKV